MDYSKLLELNWLLIVFYLSAGVTAIQVFYYLFIYSRLALHKPVGKSKTQQHPVSVIVCARDEDENLARHLPGLLVQHYPSSYEVIVVNDNSVDDSKYILQELKKTFKDRLHVVELTQEAKLITGKKYPLSVGIKEARHEIMLLTDADCVPASENWIARMQEAYDDSTEIVIGYGAYHKAPGLLNKLIRFETFHSALQYLSYALAGIPYMGVGRNLSYKKGLFFRKKGFSSINHIPGGDDDLFINKSANRKNTRVMTDPQAFTLSIPKKTFRSWYNQKNRHYSTSRYYKLLHKFLLGLYGITGFLFYPLLALTAIFYSWQYALILYGIKMFIQAVIWYITMKKLKEEDLWGWFILLDLWLFFYYLIFASTLWKKPQRSWS